MKRERFKIEIEFVIVYLPSERGAVRALSNKVNGCEELKRSEVFRLQSIGGSSSLIPDS